MKKQAVIGRETGRHLSQHQFFFYQSRPSSNKCIKTCRNEFRKSNSPALFTPCAKLRVQLASVNHSAFEAASATLVRYSLSMQRSKLRLSSRSSAHARLPRATNESVWQRRYLREVTSCTERMVSFPRINKWRLICLRAFAIPQLRNSIDVSATHTC